MAKKLCEIAITTDEVFQTELVLLASRLASKIEEVPVQILEMRKPTRDRTPPRTKGPQYSQRSSAVNRAFSQALSATINSVLSFTLVVHRTLTIARRAMVAGPQAETHW